MTSSTKWILLEYGSHEQLDLALKDRQERKLFYPAVGPMKTGTLVDLQITIEGTNVLFPMGAEVIEVHSRPNGPDAPRGVLLRIIEADQVRFDRLCAFSDGVWRPGVRRSAPRYPLVMQASYYLGSTFYNAETLNISTGGFLLRSDDPLAAVGQGLFVRLHPPRSLRPIGFDTQVCWLDEVPSRRSMGIQCMGPPKSLKKLDKLITKMMLQVKL